jgi:hypothetical protein
MYILSHTTFHFFIGTIFFFYEVTSAFYPFLNLSGTVYYCTIISYICTLQPYNNPSHFLCSNLMTQFFFCFWRVWFGRRNDLVL